MIIPHTGTLPAGNGLEEQFLASLASYATSLTRPYNINVETRTQKYPVIVTVKLGGRNSKLSPYAKNTFHDIKRKHRIAKQLFLEYAWVPFNTIPEKSCKVFSLQCSFTCRQVTLFVTGELSGTNDETMKRL